MFRRDFTVGCGSTSGVLDGRDREDVAAYIARFYPTFGELSDEAIILQVGSVTIHGTCYKADLNTILLAEMSHTLPVFASLTNIWVCETCVFWTQTL